MFIMILVDTHTLYITAEYERMEFLFANMHMEGERVKKLIAIRDKRMPYL